jgi:hypothetical protein
MQFGCFVHFAGPDKASKQRYRDAHEQIEFLDEWASLTSGFPNITAHSSHTPRRRC